MGALLAVAVVVSVLVIGILLEGRRQARVHGRPSGRPNLLGVGLLELQRQLQPDRRVEVLVEQQKGEIAAVSEDEGGEGGAEDDGLTEGGGPQATGRAPGGST